MLAAWQATIVDESGNVQSAASVEVLLESSGATAALFSDRNGASPISNPITVGSDGFVRFYAAGNSYRINATKGAFTRTWRHVPVGLLGEKDTISSSLVTYDRTSVEVSESVTPVFTIYAPSPRIDVRRHLTAWDDGSTQTTGLQAAINMAYAQRGRLILPNGLDVASGALTLTMGGNRTNQGFAIEGPGWNGAKITQTGAMTTLLTIAGQTPDAAPNEAPIVLEGFSLEGTGKTAAGLLLNGVGYWLLSNVQARDFTVGFHLKSALLGDITNNCMSNENNFGLLAVRDGALPYPDGGSGCNRITVSDSIFNLNSSWGLYIDSGSNWTIRDLDIEANGTSGDVNTGGIRLTTGLDDDVGYGVVSLKSLWMEGNLGTPLLVDSTGGLTLSIENTLMLNSGEDDREIWILGADRVSIRETLAPAAVGAVWDITATHLTLENVLVTTLTDTGVTYPNYRGVGMLSGSHINGRSSSYTGTLTGCTTSPTGTITAVKQGNEVKLAIPQITGTSNTTAATITGMPVALRPSATRIGIVTTTNNGVDIISRCSVGTDGTITLYNGTSTTFTNSGTKGILTSEISYFV